MAAPAWVGPAINVGSQILGGIFGGKSKPNPLAQATESNMLELWKLVMADDPGARIEEAQQAALRFATTMGTQSIDAALANISAGGGKVFLPSTQRGGAVSAALQPTMQTLALQTAQAKSQAFEQFLGNALSVAQTTQAGRGQNLPRTGGSSLDPVTLFESVNELLKNI